ncbi:MAG: hypothetical protein OEM01_07585 [Desulfobulbaceae bacterium]|nr:hypothetical protein [Desulfobulbaceae bacterium]
MIEICIGNIEEGNLLRISWSRLPEVFFLFQGYVLFILAGRNIDLGNPLSKDKASGDSEWISTVIHTASDNGVFFFVIQIIGKAW